MEYNKVKNVFPITPWGVISSYVTTVSLTVSSDENI